MEITIRRSGSVRLLSFVAPALVFYVAFVLVPAAGGIYYSFTNWNMLRPDWRFVGLANYVEALGEDRYFISSLLFTLKYVAFMVVLQNVLALLLAILVENLRRGRLAFRTLLFMPNMISMIIAGFMWLFVFTRVIPGLAQHNMLAFLDRSWIGDPRWSFVAILLVSLWAGVGYLMVIYVAALQGVPRQMMEAAAIDGAGPVRGFFRVTLPMIALNIFEEAFNLSQRFGYASAKATLLFLVVFAVTAVQLRIMKAREVQA
jgi:raffinose/stachyose/melibiose transport system permease protein